MDPQVQESYLSAMGVSQWYPKYALPNAPELDWPEITDIPVGEAERIRPVEVLESECVARLPSESLVNLRTIFEDGKSVAEECSVKPGEHADKEVPVRDASLDVVVPPFSFLFSRYSLGVALVIGTPNELLSSVELRFIDGVMAFLGISNIPEFQRRVDWPLVKNNREFQTKGFLHESMSTLFEKQAAERGVNTFIVFGKGVTEQLSPILDELYKGAMTTEETRTECLVVPSSGLFELMMSADEKRKLWQQLLTLKVG